MGKRKSAKAGGAAESILRAAKHHEDQDAGSDGEDRDKSEDYMSFISKANQKNENDDSLSDASSVFDLAAGGHSDDTSTSGDDDSSSENDSSEEDGGVSGTLLPIRKQLLILMRMIRNMVPINVKIA